MVQEKLLTRHPGSIHGGEETPGGQSSIQQGAGKRSSGAPDLGSAAAAEQWRDCKIGFSLRSFPLKENKKAKGGSQRWTRGPRRPPGATRGGAALGGRLGPRAPLWPLSGSSRSFLHADFLSEFSRIFLALFIWGKTEIEKQQKTGIGTGVH